MSYADQAPPRRPAAVVAAAAVLVLMAVGAGLYAVTGLLVMGGTTDRFRSAAATTGAGTGEIDAVVSLLRAATVLSAVVSVLVGLVLVGLALGLLAGRSGARVTTWVVCGLGLLCGCGAVAVLIGQRAAPLRLGTDQRVTADLLAQLGDAYPGWWIPVNAALSVAQILGYLVVAALLALPAANAFLHRRPAGPRPPAAPTPPSYGPVPGYGPPPAYGPPSATGQPSVPPAYGPPAPEMPPAPPASAPPGPTPPPEDRP